MQTHSLLSPTQLATSNHWTDDNATNTRVLPNCQLRSIERNEYHKARFAAVAVVVTTPRFATEFNKPSGVDVVAFAVLVHASEPYTNRCVCVLLIITRTLVGWSSPSVQSHHSPHVFCTFRPNAAAHFHRSVSRRSCYVRIFTSVRLMICQRKLRSLPLVFARHTHIQKCARCARMHENRVAKAASADEHNTLAHDARTLMMMMSECVVVVVGGGSVSRAVRTIRYDEYTNAQRPGSSTTITSMHMHICTHTPRPASHVSQILYNRRTHMRARRRLVCVREHTHGRVLCVPLSRRVCALCCRRHWRR